MGMSPETSLHMVQILCICIVHHPAAPFGARSSVAARSLVTEKAGAGDIRVYKTLEEGKT